MAAVPNGDPYLVKYPAWRESLREVEETILEQLLVDREVGRKVQLVKGGPYLPSGSLRRWQLEEAARKRAQQVLEDAVRRYEDPAAEYSRQQKLGEAA